MIDTNDLFSSTSVETLKACNAELLEALEYCIKQVPEFSTVPGIKAAIAKARGEE